MSFWLLLLVTLAYAWIAIESLIKGPMTQGIIFAGYSLANIGFLIAMANR
jgi:hypothetical protein